jgi:hypothetical protein
MAVYCAADVKRRRSFVRAFGARSAIMLLVDLLSAELFKRHIILISNVSDLRKITMNRKQIRMFSAVIGTLCLFTALGGNLAIAKKTWTITERQVALRKEVDSGVKANELTLKEANSLRDRLSEISADIQKMKDKNGGKLSYKDEGKLEKRLNSLSVDIQKEKLAKRTTSR